MATLISTDEQDDLKSLDERMEAMSDEFKTLMIKSAQRGARLTLDEKQRMQQLEKMLSQLKHQREVLKNARKN